MEVRVAKWLRVTTYVIAGSMGIGGAMLGYSKPATMLAMLAVTLFIESINYLANRRKGDNA